MAQAVKDSDDLRRVLALPSREPSIDASFVNELTAILKTPNGTMRLRPLQALALHDIGICGGAFLPLDVGEGKTLISLLAPVLLGATRPLLLLRAHLIQKTTRERDELARHWRIPNHIRFMSYQMLGLVQSAKALDDYKPDLIIADEVQALKNRDAAVTRRVERYMDANPTTRFVGMTGTIMRSSIKDFAHSLRWALKDGAPVPLSDHVLDDWALALDEKLENEFMRMEPGALLQLADRAELASLPAIKVARQGFRRRLRETAGVVCSAESGTQVDATLTIRPFLYELSPITIEHFGTLRHDKKTPEGYDIWEAAEVWRHARELALGFHQIWDPLPPEEWKTARREWFSFVRAVLSRSRSLDSPDHVAMACDLGKLPSDKLEAWRAVKDTFTPNPVPVWHDDSALRAAAGWMREPGIVWVEHVPFGERLAALTGAKYYGADGLASDGEFIDDGDSRRSIIASVKANREGRNLQSKWFRNLVTTPAEGADSWQQLLGRTHRPGQTAREVTVDVFIGCGEHVAAWRKALAGAASIRDTVGSQSKLLIANTRAWPSDWEMASWVGDRWSK